MTLPAAHFHSARAPRCCMPQRWLARLPERIMKQTTMSRSTTAILLGATFALAIVSLESAAQTRQPASPPAADTMQQRRATPVPAAKPLQPSATTTRPVEGKPMTVRANPQKQGLKTTAQTTQHFDIKKEKQKACMTNCMKRSDVAVSSNPGMWSLGGATSKISICTAKCYPQW
jgi:hypothetical protein